MIGRFLQEESGATSIEYAMVASMISVAIIGGIIALQGATQHLWQSTADALPGDGAPPPPAP